MTAPATRRSRVRAPAAGLIAAVAVCWVQGLFPGDAPDGAAAQLYSGVMQCAHDMGWRSLTSSCDALGIPAGFPYLLGAPWIVLGSLLMHLPFVEADAAYLVVGWVAVAVGVLGGYRLMRRLGTSLAVAIGSTVAYLCSASVLGLGAFGPTWTGFVVLPFVVWTNVATLDRLDRGGRWRVVLALWPVALLAVFTDGYSFVAGALVVACVWGAWAVASDLDVRRRVGAVGTVAVVNLTAVLAYRAYVPGGGFDTGSIDLVRAMGADVVTLVAPTDRFWFWSGIGWHRDITLLWGDGSNAAFNYLGFVVVGLAVGWLVHRRGRAGAAAIALAVAGTTALVMALGPSLKVASNRADALDAVVTYESYLMPTTEAVVTLPTAPLFEHVPGVADMRAAYRWILVTRFSLLVLAGLAVDALAGSGRRALAVGLAALAVVETAPNLGLEHRRHAAFGAQIETVRGDVIPDLRDVVVPGERVLFLPAGNDYLADLLAPSAGVATYNAGGDKNVAIARRSWPSVITAAAASFATASEADAIVTALRSGVLDAVVLPRFDLRWSAYHWPPTPREQLTGDAAAVRLAGDDRVVLDEGDWFHVVRLRPAG